MRVRRRLASFIVLLILCTACDRKGRSTAPAGATAEVTPTRATFTIPVEQRSVWRWHLETTPFDAFEYSWEISQKDVRSFGFSLWKNGDQPPEQGNLSQLIEAGQGSIWEPTSSGGGRLVGSIGVTAARDGSAVELILLEQPIIEELFENRPPTLEVVARTLDTAKHDRPGVPIYSVAEQRYSIDVNYRDR